MRHLKQLIVGVIVSAPSLSFAANACPELLNRSLPPLRGDQPVALCEAYAGKVILAVNTASRCGFTPQFKGLEALYQKYRDRGLVVLGFPSDDFRQEYAEAEKTAEVCYINYGVTFPMFQKSAVTGQTANPLFRDLTLATGRPPTWNFFKYLIDRQGRPQAVYASAVTPDDPKLQQRIEELLSDSSE